MYTYSSKIAIFVFTAIKVSLETKCTSLVLNISSLAAAYCQLHVELQQMQITKSQC